MLELTLLTAGQVWENDYENKLDVLKKYGTISMISDLAILTGGSYMETSKNIVPDCYHLTTRVGCTYTKSLCFGGDVQTINCLGERNCCDRYFRDGIVRPVLIPNSLFPNISSNGVMGYDGIYEVEYGCYPQWAPDEDMQRKLEFEYKIEYKNSKLRTTGRSYTFDRTNNYDYSQGFQEVTYNEYEFDKRKYIRVKANSSYDIFSLSNGMKYRNGAYVWIEVTPVKWLIDYKTKALVSKIGLLSGIRFHTKQKKYNGDFSTTEMNEYLNKHMLRDLSQTIELKNNLNIFSDKCNKNGKENFDSHEITENEVINSKIEKLEHLIEKYDSIMNRRQLLMKEELELDSETNILLNEINKNIINLRKKR